MGGRKTLSRSKGPLLWHCARRIRKLVLGFKHASGRPSTSKKADQEVDIDIDLDEIEDKLDEDPYQDEAEGEGEDPHARQQEDSALRKQHLGGKQILDQILDQNEFKFRSISISIFIHMYIYYSGRCPALRWFRRCS